MKSDYSSDFILKDKESNWLGLFEWRNVIHAPSTEPRAILISFLDRLPEKCKDAFKAIFF